MPHQGVPAHLELKKGITNREYLRPHLIRLQMKNILLHLIPCEEIKMPPRVGFKFFQKKGRPPKCKLRQRALPISKSLKLFDSYVLIYFNFNEKKAVT